MNASLIRWFPSSFTPTFYCIIMFKFNSSHSILNTSYSDILLAICISTFLPLQFCYH
jgi:hypothetical protein